MLCIPGKQVHETSDSGEPRTIAPAIPQTLCKHRWKKDERDGGSEEDQPDKIELFGEEPVALQIRLLHWQREVVTGRRSLYKTELVARSRRK